MRHLASRAYAFTPGVPPDEIQLWNVGDNSTDFGVHRWTDRSIELVTASLKKRGNKIQIDIEHNAADQGDEPPKSDPEPPKSDPEPPVTGGYCTLDVRGKAPWVRFEWSAPAVEQIETRQRLYLSPEYDVDSATGEIVGLTRVSLVGNPATHNARILASAEGEKRSMDPILLAALEAAMTADDPKAALAALLASLKKGAEPAATEVQAEAPSGPPAPPEEPKPVVAAAPPAEEPKPVVAAAPPPAEKPVEKITASAPGVDASRALSELTKRIDEGERDRLLETRGATLEPHIRVWASAQPLRVVKSFLDTVPAASVATTRVAATRGESQGEEARRGLEGAELAEFERACGIRRVAASAPRKDEFGRLVFSNIPPAEWRRIKASMAGKEG